MSLKSKVKPENIGMLMAFTFYALVGAICLVVLAIVDFRLIHIGLLGILSLMTAYGLFMSRKWTIWILIALFSIAMAFSTYTIYSALGKDVILSVVVFFYLLFTCIFTVYTIFNRQKLRA